MNPEANGEISNEFFKKLNQQIVQKDNLIKLLQLQIRNLKTQIEAGGSGSEELGQLKKALEEKSSESERLVAELDTQKSQFSELEQQKDDQIKALSEMLEQHQANSSTVAEAIEDPRVSELEQLVSSLREDLENSTRQAEALKEEFAASAVHAQQKTDLQMALDASQAEIAQLNASIEEFKTQLMAKEAEFAGASIAGTGDAEIHAGEIKAHKSVIESQSGKIEAQKGEIEARKSEIEIQKLELESNKSQLDAYKSEIEFQKNRIFELEQDVASLKNVIAEKDEAAKDGSAVSGSNEDLLRAQAEMAGLRAELASLRENPVAPASMVDELERLRQESSTVAELKADLEKLTIESASYAEAAMKITALELEREQLSNDIERLKATAGDSEQLDSYKLEVARLREVDRAREDELARLRVSIDARQDDSMNDPLVREEVEQLTSQVADQLLAIQNFESMMGRTREQLKQKDVELEMLRSRSGSAASATGVIPVTGESEIITSFIDFFDGLDMLLIKNPLPELQTLHQKLLERLIIPNQITYMQVISEEFDPDKHCATDYFRSANFPERCIVFEVEKGYRKADMVIKKSKVWVVQNLFSCEACGAIQSNPDSRFCHLCGAKIVAPNGLPVDSLPEFEPSPVTYQRFAERMLEVNNQTKAKEYILAGLKLDQNFVPLMIKLADILTAESKFEEAMELLKKANSLKADAKIQERIQSIETKVSIFKQAKSLKLSPEEFEKLLHLIQK